MKEIQGNISFGNEKFLLETRKTPKLLPGLELFFERFEEAFFEFCVPLAFLDDMVAVVAAEVGEPRLCGDGFAVGGGGFEVVFGDPSGDGLPAVAEKLRDGAYGQHARLCAPFGEEVEHVFLALFGGQIGLFSALLDRGEHLRKFDRVDIPRTPEHILAEYGIAPCFLAGVDAGDVSVLEHPSTLAFADM